MRFSADDAACSNGMRPSIHRRQRRAASALEFAIVGTTFCILILGIFELGRGLMVMQLLTGGARIGCRTGILEGKANSDITTAVSNYLTGVGINGDTISVKVNDGTGNVNTSNPGDEVTVSVTVPVTSITWVPGGIFPFGNISGQYTMRRE
jgi:Flp pilus assembly protein TadG